MSHGELVVRAIKAACKSSSIGADTVPTGDSDVTNCTSVEADDFVLAVASVGSRGQLNPPPGEDHLQASQQSTTVAELEALGEFVREWRRRFLVNMKPQVRGEERR